MKGRGITWHFSPVSVPIQTQLGIYCLVDFYCLLSVSDDSVPKWLCDYSEGTMVFILAMQGKLTPPSQKLTLFENPLNTPNYIWVCETSPSHKYSLLDWRVSLSHLTNLEGFTTIIPSVKTTPSDNYFYSIRSS